MTARHRPILMAVALVTGIAAPAGAQNLMLSGSVQRDTQRFPEGDAPTRLDGSATGWMAGGGVRFWNHLALAIEWSDAGTIEDVRTTALDIDGRTVAITSTFRHHTRTAAALGGYSHTAVVACAGRVSRGCLLHTGEARIRIERPWPGARRSIRPVGVRPLNARRSVLGHDRRCGCIRPSQMAAPCGRRPAGPEDHPASRCLWMECQDVRRRGVGAVRKRLLPCAVALLAALATPLCRAGTEHWKVRLDVFLVVRPSCRRPR